MGKANCPKPAPPPSELAVETPMPVGGPSVASDAPPGADSESFWFGADESWMYRLCVPEDGVSISTPPVNEWKAAGFQADGAVSKWVRMAPVAGSSIW